MILWPKAGLLERDKSRTLQCKCNSGFLWAIQHASRLLMLPAKYVQRKGETNQALENIVKIISSLNSQASRKDWKVALHLCYRCSQQGQYCFCHFAFLAFLGSFSRRVWLRPSTTWIHQWKLNKTLFGYLTIKQERVLFFTTAWPRDSVLGKASAFWSWCTIPKYKFFLIRNSNNASGGQAVFWPFYQYARWFYRSW